MGLFDFAKDMGKKLFGTSADADAAENIHKHLLLDNPGINNLNVSVEGEVVTLTGVASTQAAKEKAVLLAGNIAGISKVEADSLTVDSLEEVISVEFYEIQKGDTLWKVSEKYLGNGSKYTYIFEANKEVIKDPDLIYPGQKIRIPMPMDL